MSIYVIAFAILFGAAIGLVASYASGGFGDCCGSLLFAVVAVFAVLVIMK